LRDGGILTIISVHIYCQLRLSEPVREPVRPSIISRDWKYDAISLLL